MGFPYDFNCNMPQTLTQRLPRLENVSIHIPHAPQLHAPSFWPPPLKTYVKWQKIKYPVVKMRFSDKCDIHATRPGRQTNKQTAAKRERERERRDKQTNTVANPDPRETLGEVSNGVICDRHARDLPARCHTHNACPAINMGKVASPASQPLRLSLSLPHCSPDHAYSNPIATHSLAKFLARSYSWAPLVCPELQERAACFMTVFAVEIKLQFQTSLASFIFMGFALCHALLQLACISPRHPATLDYVQCAAKVLRAKWINAIGIGRWYSKK